MKTLLLQLTIGPRKKVSRAQHNSPAQDFPVGSIVLTDVTIHKDWPQVGEVLHITEEGREIVWYKTRRQTWSRCKRREGGRFALWTEEVAIDQIIFGFQKLTKSGFLTTKAKAFLKDYSRI